MPTQRRRYARQLLLTEIGERGQVALCATHACIADRADTRAAEGAAQYVERAGIALAPLDLEGEKPALAIAVPSSDAVGTLAGDLRLREAAATLAGSFAAVEAIKCALGVGTPA